MRFMNVAGGLALWLPLMLLHASTGAAAPERFRIFSEPVTASALLGKEVRNRNGEYLGTVGELVFDLPHNRTPRVVLDLQNGRPSYPMHALKLPTARGYVVLDVADNPRDQEWDGEKLVSAHRLLGAGFETSDRGAAGTLIDVVLDAFWGNVAFAVLRLDGDRLLRAAPLDAFHAPKDEAPMVLRLGRDALAGLPAFTREHLEAHVTDVPFLQRTARLAHQLTPVQ